MWDGEEGVMEKAEQPCIKGPSPELHKPHPIPVSDPGEVDLVAVEDMDNEEEDEQEGANAADQETPDQHGVANASTPTIRPDPVSNCGQKTTDNLQAPGSTSPLEQEQDGDPDFDIDPDPDGEFDGDTQAESHPCSHCERRFSTRQGLERHIHIHAITNQPTQLFKCRYCNKPFGSQVGRRRHERRHESGPKKKPGSLAGTANLITHVGQTDVSSPDSTGQTNHFIAMGPQFARAPLHNPEVQRAEASPHFDRPYALDENGESKELHPCKYCNKAFGTHTNMRRHQRRIHERHLLPKGVRRKGMLLQETAQQQPDESPSASPPPVYVPSADTEDEADRDDYVVDISKNISENLSFYIDGKIVSTSTVSTCEVIEVDSRSAALFGLDTVIIGPNQLSQALKIEGRTNATKSISGLPQASSKRRTSTPPLVPSLKVETDTQSFTASTSSTSSSSNLLVGGLFQPETDPSHFQREKTVYLSPKLKQLLQTKDIQKTTITLLPESNNLASPLSVTPLQGSSGRFKRRTSSPPSSPQHSPASKTESLKSDARGLFTLKVPKLETNFAGSFQDEEESIALSPSGDSHQLCPNSGEKSCNQLPLDLSSAVSRWNDTQVNVVQGDSALDLSFHRKGSMESESPKATQPLAKKRKPNTSMLEKVLMNEYAGLSVAGDEGVGAVVNTSCNNSCSSNVTSDSAHPSPPSLTPVTLNPSSPTSSIVTSPTPPPPVLPTIPSPPPNPDSPSSQPSDSAGLRPFPILSPEMSPRKETEEDISMEEKEDGNISEPRDSNPDTPLEEHLSESGSPEHKSVDAPAPEDETLKTSHSLQNGDTHLDAPKSSTAAVSSQPESPPASISPAPSPTLDNPSPPLSPPLIKVKEEQEAEEILVTSHERQDVVSSSPLSPATKLPNKPSDGGEMDFPYCKNFVCNVCEAPFNSMKELGVHISDHAAEWPFKCEFCVQLFGDAPALLSHRTTLHGVGKIFVCSVCCKEFAFLCNLQLHQKDLHPNETCLHTTVESGKLRPQNYTDPSKAKEESSPSTPAPEAPEEASPQQGPDKLDDEPDVNGNHAGEGEEEEPEDPTEELYTTIKIMASEGGKPKGPDVRLGINQHYPSYKPPPFPYHSRSHTGSVASATNFTTHNIPQTFTTAIRCTKCGNSFDNMPELHKHILACANASDKKRYTPKKNPIPLKQIVKSPNGVVSPSAAAGQSAFRRMGQPKRLNFGQDAGKTKLSALSKKKNQLVQKAISQKNKAANSAKKAVKVEEEPKNVCPHCNREFTYTASLTKHISISCPMKPVAKKDKVKKEPTDKSMTLRKKATDTEQLEPESKPLGKTRARTSGAVEPDPSQTTKGKNSRPAAPQKRPASSPQADPTSKKQKKVPAQSLPPTPSAPDTPDDSAPRPASRMQRMGKVAAPKKVAEVKPPTQQPKKEERFSLRTRERARGPVTRSLQTGAAEDKSEESAIPEPKATQEVK